MDQPLASSSGSVVPRPSNGSAQAVAGDPDSSADLSAEVPVESLSFQDQQTLGQLRRGNYAAMEQLVGRYQDRLYVTILRMVNHPEDAADLVQETFVRAMQGVARFEGKSTLYTWLFRIAVNLAVSHRRSMQYRATQTLEAPSEDGDGSVNQQAAGLRRQLAQETEDDPAVSVERKLEYERLMTALAGLEPEFRAVIVLRDVEECDYHQIAAILEVPVGTIKSRLFRARLALREAMKTPAQKRSA